MVFCNLHYIYTYLYIYLSLSLSIYIGPTIHFTNLALMQVGLIAVSCCVCHICMVGGVVVVVACRCCIPYRLALMLASTFAPCVLTFAPSSWPCACGVSLLSTGANIPLAQVVVFTSCNLRRWCFFIQSLAQIVHLHTWWYHPLQLALVVLFHPPTGADTALAPGQLALCGGGQWWWYIVACRGGGIYIWNLHWHLSNLYCVVVIYSGDRCMWKQNVSFHLSIYRYLNKNLHHCT